MMITEKVEVSDKILASGGFADVRTGMYMKHPVAVKTMRVAEQDGFSKLRKVSVEDVVSLTLDTILTTVLRRSPAILQGSSPLEYTVPPERLETRWGSREHG